MKKVLYEPDTVQPAAATLSLVSRQLHAEVQDAVARLQSKEGRRCKVDVMFLEEKELWVTPLRTSAHSPVLDEVETVIRMVGVIPDADLSARKTIWDGGCGAPPYYIHIFYCAFERFLRAGPTGRPANIENGAKIDRHMAIHHLILNFVTPTPDEHHPLAADEERDQCMAARRGTVPVGHNVYRMKLMRPEWLAGDLLDMLKIMTTGHMYVVEHARLVFERVGLITAQIDGRPYRELNVGALLKTMEFSHDPGSSMYEEAKAVYPVWRREVFAARAAAGLA